MPTKTKTNTKRSRTPTRKISPRTKATKGMKMRPSMAASVTVSPPPLPVFPVNMVQPLSVFKPSISHAELIIATAFLAAAVMFAIAALYIPLV